MSSPHDDAFEARLARLERLVDEIHQRLPAPAAAPVRPAPIPWVPEPVRRPADSISRMSDEELAADGPLRSRGRRAPAWPAEDAAALFRWDGQTWLNRLGIIMLLLGVGLLFRYSIDQGWLTPAVRVAFGLAVGTVLTGLGLWMGEERRFASVPLGGGVAAFYITGWAAFNLYALVPYTLAFVGMVAITLAASGLALWRSQPALAVLGAAGGLGVPLLLGISYASPSGLAAYTSFILAWTVVPYLRRGWRMCLWASMSFGWLLLALYANWLPETFRAGVAGRGWITGAAAFAWIVLGVLPLARRVAGWYAGPHARERRWSGLDALHWYGVAGVPPAMLVVVSGLAWRMDAREWGALAIAVAAVYALAAAALRVRDARLARVLVFSAAVLLPVGCLGALRGATLLVALAAQGLALHLVAERGAGLAARWMAHKLMLGVACWLVVRITGPSLAGAWRLPADAAAIAAIFWASWTLRTREHVTAYRLFAHGAGMGLVLRELAGLEGGQGIATIVWGAYGLALLLYALRTRWPALERVAIATLLATVGKLFIVDLARLDSLFRVLLFLGFGAVFLFLSYTLTGWLRTAAEPEPQPAGRDA